MAESRKLKASIAQSSKLKAERFSAFGIRHSEKEIGGRPLEVGSRNAEVGKGQHGAEVKAQMA